MKSKAFLYITVFSLISFHLHSQIPNNSWRDHLPYSHARCITEVENKIFCSTTGGLFSYNKSDNSVQKYSKVNGLSDIRISIIDYSEETESLVIGYENGNIDIIWNDTVTNISDIKRKFITGDKRINNILFINEYAYLACGFGIVILNLQKKEIKDTYQFGEMGAQLKVNDIAFDGANLYAACAEGIYKASINSPNLVDYNSWSRLTAIPAFDAEYKNIVYFNDKILSTYFNTSSEFDEIIEINSTGWNTWINYQPNHYKLLEVHNNHLHVLSSYLTEIYDSTETRVYSSATVFPQYAQYDKDHILWIADSENGLIRSYPGSYQEIYPNGPKYIDVGELNYSDGHIWVASGNSSNVWAHKGAYMFSNETWKSYNIYNVPVLEEFFNISEIAIDPVNPEHVYGGSTGYGIVDLLDENATIYDETDGILETIEGYSHGFIFITGLAFDKERNLWISSNLSEKPVYVLRTNGTWETLDFDYSEFGINTRVNDIFVTSNNQIWLLLERKGIFVFQENQDGTISERFFAITNNDGELIDRVYSIAEDLDGNIWLGTGNGPIVYYNPYDIFDVSNVVGYQIKIPRNDGTSLADILLQNEKINSICIDGANRKWFATDKSGVFLMSEDAKQEIHNFNADNSPLFSDNVLSIAINQKNGEVFFGTDQGILSFKGQATTGSDSYENVYVYPNPVRENYTGDITITGLVANVNVKITDIAGNIVYETTALGGQAIWDGKNFSGEKVHTGVYLVFCTNEDGTKTHVTKLLFIH